MAYRKLINYQSVNLKGINIIKKQYVDAGNSITLSDQVLTSSDGRLHTGWVVDGKEYMLGAVISNVNKDLVVRPKWAPRSIN